MSAQAAQRVPRHARPLERGSRERRVPRLVHAARAGRPVVRASGAARRSHRCCSNGGPTTLRRRRHDRGRGRPGARGAPRYRERADALYPSPVVSSRRRPRRSARAAGADALRDVVTGDAGRGALARSGWRVDGEDPRRRCAATSRAPDRAPACPRRARCRRSSHLAAGDGVTRPVIARARTWRSRSRCSWCCSSDRVHRCATTARPATVWPIPATASPSTSRRRPRSSTCSPTSPAVQRLRRRDRATASASFVRVQTSRRRARRARCSPTDWPEPQVNGPQPGRLVAGGERVGRGRRTSGAPTRARADRRRRREAVHAHAARDRDARADGRGARLARHADRLRRHPRARAGPERAGRAYGPPRVGRRSGSARPTPTSRPAGSPRTIAQYYAATGKTRDLTLEDLAPARGRSDFARGVESAVVHYGDTTLTFLNNLYRNDARGNVAHLRLRGRRRGEVGHRLQPRQPRRRSSTRARSRASRACRSSRSTRRKARSSPTTRSSCSTRRG